MKSLRILHLYRLISHLAGANSKKVILCIDVLNMVYNMAQTVLLYVAFEAGSKMQKWLLQN